MSKRKDNPPSTRCAIYTRKSTEEGLEQDFNSLDAQREAGEAYITSQKHEGWVCLPAHYDDGGFTGANMDRPAFQRLMADVEVGKVDCIVVYKIDRLSRSLMDFARIMEVLEQRGVSLVSVTQQFNTTTSMGRLTLNVLLAFAQFERDMIAARIADSRAYLKKHGRRLAGKVPYGYRADPVTRQLVPDRVEARRVREIEAFLREVMADPDTWRMLLGRGATDAQGPGGYPGVAGPAVPAEARLPAARHCPDRTRRDRQHRRRYIRTGGREAVSGRKRMIRRFSVNRPVAGESGRFRAKYFGPDEGHLVRPIALGGGMEQEGPYWVYVLQNPQGRFYVGQTPNLDKRLREHNTPVSGEMTWPHKHGPWRLVWKEPHATRGQAVQRERQIVPHLDTGPQVHGLDSLGTDPAVIGLGFVAWSGCLPDHTTLTRRLEQVFR